MTEWLSLTLQCDDPEDLKLLHETSIHKNLDFLFYSANIDTPNVESFISRVGVLSSDARDEREHNQVLLFLSTNGGDADAAYRMARFLQRDYDRFTLCVLGFCKSAGTLLALGADQLVMGPRSELGPLDVQVFDPDEFLQRSSGFAIYQALDSLGEKCFDLFEHIFLEVRARSGGNITTQTASEIAASIAVGLYSPVTQQIDCTRIGELQRSLDIAVEYGKRLGADDGVVRHLAEDYPSHSFVIDKEECSTYFEGLRERNPVEDLLAENLRAFSIEQYGRDLTRYPTREGVMGCVMIEEATDEISESESECKGASDEIAESQHKENNCEGVGEDVSTENKESRERNDAN